MNALIMAGGKGTRMGRCGTEKPMQQVGGIPTIQRVVSAVSRSKSIDRVLVSVSSNTPETESFLSSKGVETVRTSGEGFMEDLHSALDVLDSDFVMTVPSDLPMIMAWEVDAFADFFRPEMESAIVVVDESTVLGTGVKPSYVIELDDGRWVLSGLCIVDRKKTLNGIYLNEEYMRTDWADIAVNVNTQYELDLARSMCDERITD
jgi:adenosylcobinamide-phosphate guanylyltransferase